MKGVIAVLVSIFVFTNILSCTDKNLGKDDGFLFLNGKGVIKLKISISDSVVSQGTGIKLSLVKPDSIVLSDSTIFKNIAYVEYSCGPMAYKINPNSSIYMDISKNFVKGNVENNHGRTSLRLKKGTNISEDTYMCRDTGLFWFYDVPQADLLKFETIDGKKFKASFTLDFDVPDRHTQMLLNYCPQLTDGVNDMSNNGFGHYVFRVVP